MEELARKIDKLSNTLTDLRWQIWIKYTLFTWQWWMLLLSTIGMVVLYVLLVRKDQLLKSFAFLGIIYILNKNLDDVATAMDWYDYRMQLEPIIPTMLPANLFIIPGVLTILYARFASWKAYGIAAGAFAVFVSFIALPLMKLTKIYEDKAWNGPWSFLSLVLMAAIAKLVVDAAVRMQNRKNSKPEEKEIHLLYASPSWVDRLRGRAR